MFSIIYKSVIVLVLFILALALSYLGISFLLSRIIIDKENSTNNAIEIYLITNGVHSDIVVPYKNDIYDWAAFVKSEDVKSADSSYNLLALGWGDKGFYLNTPSWSELKFSVAFNAVFGLSSSAIHATFYKDLKESENCVKIKINSEQYKRLVDYIKASFLLNSSQRSIKIDTKALYGEQDAFYEAIGSYSLFFTCNSWTNEALKSGGQKACYWTPFDKWIFRIYK